MTKQELNKKISQLSASLREAAATADELPNIPGVQETDYTRGRRHGRAEVLHDISDLLANLFD